MIFLKTHAKSLFGVLEPGENQCQSFSQSPHCSKPLVPVAPERGFPQRVGAAISNCHHKAGVKRGLPSLESPWCACHAWGLSGQGRKAMHVHACVKGCWFLGLANETNSPIHFAFGFWVFCYRNRPNWPEPPARRAYRGAIVSPTLVPRLSRRRQKFGDTKNRNIHLTRNARRELVPIDLSLACSA